MTNFEHLDDIMIVTWISAFYLACMEKPYFPLILLSKSTLSPIFYQLILDSQRQILRPHLMVKNLWGIDIRIF
jgi:hypothetical protein